MANTVSYGMGQIRYDSNKEYLTDLNFKVHPIATDSVSGTKSYRDIVFYSDNLTSFSSSESYYLRIGLPRNLSYNMTFDVKLLYMNSSYEIPNRNQYQEIRRIVVPRDSNNIAAYSRVILFPDGGIEPENNPVVKIAIENPTQDIINSLANGEIYYISSDDKYYIKNNGEDTEILLRNDILLNHTWKEASSTDIVYFDFVFTNKISDKTFNCILLELNRNAYDDDISFDADGTTYNGVHIDENNVEVQCGLIANMVGKSYFNTSGHTPFTSIGVWSHPDAIMSINGEEIHVGQSGYYELNNFNITNFGIVVHRINGVNNPNDKFSLDYQYTI